MSLLIVLMLLIVLNVAARLGGHDSRDGRDWMVGTDSPRARAHAARRRPRPETQSVLDEVVTTAWQRIHGETNR
jgi:uncharacterized MAPEG superfamily protein